MLFALSRPRFLALPPPPGGVDGVAQEGTTQATDEYQAQIHTEITRRRPERRLQAQTEAQEGAGRAGARGALGPRVRLLDLRDHDGGRSGSPAARAPRPVRARQELGHLRP